MIKVCGITDEISGNFLRAVDIGIALKLDSMFLRTIYGKRFPFYDIDDLKTLEKALLETPFPLDTAFIGSFRLGVECTPWEQLRRNDLAQTVALLEQFGIENCIVLADAPAAQDSVRPSVEAIRWLCRRLQRRGRQVWLKNSLSSVCRTAQDLSHFSTSVDCPNLRLSWDPLADFILGADPLRFDLAALTPMLANVHMRNAVQSEDGDFAFTGLSEGFFDLKALANALRDHGYDGRVTVEPLYMDGEHAYAGAVGYIREIFHIASHEED